MRAPRPLPALRPCAAALALALLGACTAPRLATETRVPPYAQLRAAWDRAPREALSVPVQVDGVAGEMTLTRVRAATPQAALRPTLVLQPGLLATGDTWRFLVGALEGACDLLLVDPPGTGTSTGPDPRTASEHAYGPTWLAAHTLAALEALEARERGAPTYVLLGHSLGGAVVLRALADTGLHQRHGPLLTRVRGAVLFNPADIALSTRQQMFVDLTRLTDFEVGLGERLGLLRRRVREGVLENAVGGRNGALEEEARRIEDLLGRPATRHAAQAMLRRFQPLEQDGLTRDGPAAERLAAEEAAIEQPVLVLWGLQDRTFEQRVGEDVLRRLPRGRWVPLPGAGHSSHQDAAQEAARHVREFVDGLAGGTAR